MKKFVIVAPEYNEVVGGAVVLHRLCHLLKELGYEAYVYPQCTSFELKFGHLWSCIVQYIRAVVRIFLATHFSRFKVHPLLDTPLFSGDRRQLLTDDYIIIYADNVFGNPLDAKNRVRWFLHQPGYHMGKIAMYRDELYFKFNGGIKDFVFDGSLVSTNNLKVISYPTEFYNLNNTSVERSGTAYCLRKGKGKFIVHDLNESILIDGMNHSEVAQVFKRVKYFISYDVYTAYSLFAVLCGCISIVIPDDGQSVEQWYPDVADRWGIAYGMNDLEWAKNTADLQRKRIEQQLSIVKGSVSIVAEEMLNHFR